MSEIASVDVESARGVPVARISGEIDASNASAVRDRLLDTLGNEGPGLVVDLTETRYLDSAGIRILFEVGARLGMRGMELRLVAAPDSFTADVLETVRIADRVAVDDAVPAAAGALAEALPRERNRE